MLLSTVLAFSLLAAPAPDDITAATRAWQEGRLKQLQSDDGWLTLVGLGWLQKGRTARPPGRGRAKAPARALTC